MQLILVSCLKIDRPPVGGAFNKGFSLIEMLVVLVILGVVISIAMPNLVRLQQSLNADLDKGVVERVINSLGYIAFTQRRSFEISELATNNVSGEDEFLKSVLPDDWRIVAAKPILYKENGVCMGGVISVYFKSELKFSANLSPPLCQL